MRFSRSFFVCLYFFVLLPVSAYPWGTDGHHTVGAVADTLIKGTNAGQHVSTLLGGGTLEKYAIWADCAKGYCKDWMDDEMKTFAHNNPKHHDYHYTDIPIEEDHYFETSVGANANDIVHILRQCIDVLKGNDTPQTNPHGFSPRIALILISHLVGDIHQPLHVGATYVGAKSAFVNPNKQGTKYDETQGGNFLMLTKTGNLHAYWDSSTVKRGMSKEKAHTPAEYATALLKGTQPASQTAGTVTDWPQKWADEIMPIATNAHAGMKLGPKKTVTDRQGKHLQWKITKKPANYANDARDTASTQVDKAGHRLAELLKAIWP